MHTPISAPELFGNPPVTWSQTSDLGTWVETIKYANRNNKPIALAYDDHESLGAVAGPGSRLGLAIVISGICPVSY
jgi:hypothetical protein